MSYLVDAGKGDRRYRRFTIMAGATAANLSTFTVTLYMKESGQPWSSAKSINTVSNPTELVVITAASGIIELRPLATWFNKAGDFEMLFRVGATPTYDSPSTDSRRIKVVDRP